jgi:Fe-S-cluster-containing hydrogenase component 2
LAAKVEKEKCTGCAACMLACPNFAITLKEGKAEVDAELCVDCGTCGETCEHGAVIPEGGRGGGGY